MRRQSALTAQNVALVKCGVPGVSAGAVGRVIGPDGVGVFGVAEKADAGEREQLAGRLRVRLGSGAFGRRRVGPFRATRAPGGVRRRGLLGRVRRVAV